MWIHILARGPGACSPVKKLTKKVHSGVPKYKIINLKFNKFKDSKSTIQKLFAIFFSNINPDGSLMMINFPLRIDFIILFFSFLGRTP